MGVYVYRVMSKSVVCSDGQLANVAIFAYKPFFDDKADAKMHLHSGASYSDQLAINKKLTTRVVFGSRNGRKIVPDLTSRVFENVDGAGSFYDSDIGTQKMPRINNVSIK